MSGHVGDLSPKQAQALEQFKKNIQDVMKPEFDDHFLLRWLRARQFDLKKSEKMLRDSVEWRKKWNADNILEDWTPLEVLEKYYPGGYCGCDKEGVPIWIDTLGTVDLKGMFYSVKPDDIYRYKMYYMEHLYKKLLPESSKKYGKRVWQSNLIFDMDGIGMKHLWKPAFNLFTRLLSMFEAHYPETLKTCLVINAPSIFPIAYNLAKPFLSDDTKKKIRVIGGDWKAQLLKDIEASELPVHWGGTKTDADGDKYCKSQVCMGGKIPESYYAKNQLNFVDMENFTEATVGRGSSLQIQQEVQDAGDILRYQFLTEGMDIGFGIFLRTSDKKQKADEMDVVLKSQRYDSHVIPEEGSVTCDKAGTYILRFDNTYSWVNAKQVKYLVEILEPDTSNELQITNF